MCQEKEDLLKCSQEYKTCMGPRELKKVEADEAEFFDNFGNQARQFFFSSFYYETSCGVNLGDYDHAMDDNDEVEEIVLVANGDEEVVDLAEMAEKVMKEEKGNVEQDMMVIELVEPMENEEEEEVTEILVSVDEVDEIDVVDVEMDESSSQGQVFPVLDTASEVADQVEEEIAVVLAQTKSVDPSDANEEQEEEEEETANIDSRITFPTN